MAIVPTTKNILVVAGDPSGDLHGANLIKALKQIDPEINVAALGGTRMQEVSDRFIYNLVGVGAAGFAEPLKRFPLWIRLIGLVRKYMEEKRPACVIAIDFYGFNHQVLGLASHRKIPAFYYISPQVWASRTGRAEHIARLVKQVISIFPFEGKIYEKYNVPWAFVGHPLLDIMPAPSEPPAERKPDYEWKIGLLPGSRPQEIRKHMPVFWKAFCQVKESFPNSKAYIFAAKEVDDETLIQLCKDASDGVTNEIKFEIIRENDYAMRSKMDAAITCSGTATLENALLGIPMAVVYILPWFTYRIARQVIKVPFISLANILAGKAVVKEFIQDAAEPHLIAGEIMTLLQNPGKIKATRADLLAVRKMLGEPGASQRAAGLIVEKAFAKPVVS